jgi:hypothetical protein
MNFLQHGRLILEPEVRETPDWGEGQNVLPMLNIRHREALQSLCFSYYQSPIKRCKINHKRVLLIVKIHG